MGTFQGRMDELDAKVGHGDLVGSVVVDQVYAQFQHESVWLNHPNGGKAKFLYEPLMSNHRTYLQWVAEGVFEGPGDAMQNAMTYLAAEVFLNAPVELGDLKRSGSPRVHDDGVRTHFKAPIQRRLTPAEMEVKEELRIALGLGLAGGNKR